MKVYIASHCWWAGLYCAHILEAMGHKITSRWLHLPFNSTETYSEASRADLAVMDYDDVVRSDALLLVAGPDRYSGGKFVETGIAMGIGLPITVLGRRENMLMWLPPVRVIDHPAQFEGVA